MNNLVGYPSTPDNILVTVQRSELQIEGNELVGTLRLGAQPTLQAPRTTPTRDIIGNLIRDSIGYGLDIVGGIEDITISSNTIRNNGTGGVFTAGIRLTNASSNSTRNNILARNIVSGNLGDGILVTADGDPTPPTDPSTNRGNTITQNSI